MPTVEPRSALNIGLGVASPLWPAFALAAGTGAAFYWMSHWSFGRWRVEATNLEALLEAPKVAVEASEPVLEASAETVETVVESTTPIVEAAAEAPAAPVVEPQEAAPATAPRPKRAKPADAPTV